MVTTVTVHSTAGHVHPQQLTAGAHEFVADEPERAGGDGLGPTPYELLLWSLGACTAMTLQMYARRHEWDLQEVSVKLTFERRDEALGDGEAARTEQITQEISLRGQLTDEQRERLAQIASRCPVHRTLTSGPTIIESFVASE